ncbi:hypothetical protein [Gallibacterium salpingitidis]|uniref:hypothetical protein n=1 Tax=Gallibacterium salpingitidis TaxID=505341 RepID=UPI0039BF88B1
MTVPPAAQATDTTDVDKKIQAAKDAVAEIPAKADADGNGVVSADEAKAYNAKVDAANAAKQAAEEAVNKLPAGDYKDGKNTEVAGITVPPAAQANDQDGDNYSDDIEDSAGSNRDLKESTPKTVAEQLYNNAKEFLVQAESKKSALGSGGYTKLEVQELQNLKAELEALKEKALNAGAYVRNDDGKDGVIDNITALNFQVPEVTNTANTVWAKSNRNYLLDSTTYRNGVMITALAGQEQTYKITTDMLLDKDPGASPRLLDFEDWKSTVVNPSGGGYTRYRVKDGNVVFKIDSEQAQLLGGTTNEVFELETDDGSKLKLYLSFEGNAKTVNVASMNLQDDFGYIKGELFKGAVTDDNEWSSIKVNLNNLADEVTFVKLSIKNSNGDVIGSEVKSILEGNKDVTFDMSKHKEKLTDGEYTLEAIRVADSLGTKKDIVPVTWKITVDKTPPEVDLAYKVVGDKLFAVFTSPENNVYWSDNGNGNQDAFNSKHEFNTVDGVKQVSFEVTKDGKYSFFDAVGNWTTIPVTAPIKLNRLTVNIGTDGGPVDGSRDGKNSQIYSSSSPIKLSGDRENVLIVSKKANSDEYSGFIDGNGDGALRNPVTYNGNSYKDTIIAEGMGSMVTVNTQGGDDVIKLNRGMIGYGNNFWYSNMDGEQKISMGDGNDSFEITGSMFEGKSLWKTTAKIDMGAGDDKIVIANNILADADAVRYRSNYFNLGAGNDEMKVSGYIEDTGAQGMASNVINLGEGHDKFTAEGVKNAFLLVSKGTSEININHFYDGMMILGGGNDKVTLGDVDGAKNASRTDAAGRIVNVIENSHSSSGMNFWNDWYNDLPSTTTSGGHRGMTINDVQLWDNSRSFINLGAGDDVITVGTSKNIDINGGNGWDQLIVNGNSSSFSMFSLNISGIDSSVINDNSGMTFVTGVEEINLHGQNNKVYIGKLNESNLKDYAGSIVVQGESGQGNLVNFFSSKWTSDSTTVDGSKIGSSIHGTYHVYTYSGADNLKVYVDIDLTTKVNNTII